MKMEYYTLLNQTKFLLYDYPGKNIFYFSFCLPMILILFIGNVIVIATVFTYNSLKKPTYLILTSLAVTDLLTSVIAVPMEIYRRTNVNDITCSARWEVYLLGMTYICGFDSMLHMVMVTFDRYVAVVKPLRYNALVTKERIAIAVMIGWIISVFSVIGQVVIYHIKKTVPSAICVGIRYDPDIYSILLDLSIFVMTTTSGMTMVILNAIILRTAIRQLRRIADVERALDNATGGSESREEAARKMKACKVISCVVSAFIICHTPIGIMHLCFAVSDSVLLNGIMNEISFVLYLISSAVNPLIYCLVDRVFRQCAWRMLSSRAARLYQRDNGQTSDGVVSLA
ncbi:alpha-1A adrenergic receptor-like [Lytechinus pictus]|uniref:alpha-1A adrenergic receptor-like n=1 Tax=Lytechinus pictus TaxID=7653 RepID=UPI0030BA02BB